MYCLPLHSELALDQVGGKAYNLSRMLQQGFPVPLGFVVTNHAFAAFDQNSDAVKLALKTELNRLAGNFPERKFMVRSSAVGEDSGEHSFAGQLESFISEGNAEALLENVLKCWRSYDKENVRVYQEQTGHKLNGMGVVVQELMDPDFAGVLFTNSVLQEGYMLAEFVEGHGEKLVSGKVNPQHFHLCRRTGSPDAELPFSFSDAHLQALKLEKLFGGPQDIEWVIRDGRFYLVQSRPITAAAKGPKIYWSNTNVTENYPEAITPLLYSVARDSYYHYFKNLAGLFQVPAQKIQEMEGAFSNIIGTFGYRMYYNMTSIHKVISASPFAGLLGNSFNNFVGYQGEEKVQPTGNSLAAKARFLKDFLRLNLALGRNVKAFETEADHFSRQTENAFSATALRDSFHAFIRIRMHSWYKASLADFFAMAYHGLLGTFTRRFYPENYQGIQNQLIQAIPNLISSKPIIETWKIAQLVRKQPAAFELLQTAPPELFLKTIRSQIEFSEINLAIENYLQNWGFRCSGELMLTQPNYAELPEKYVQLLQQYVVQHSRDPEEIIAGKYRERQGIIKTFRQRILKKRGLNFPLAFAEIGVLHLLVSCCSHGIASRERVRLKQALLYFRFKTVLLRIDALFRKKGLLENEQDILFLKYPEINENLNGSDMLPSQLKAIAALRKQQFTKDSEQIYPNDFFTHLGEYPGPEAVKTEPAIANKEGVLLQGLPACGGRINGRVKVLESILEAGKLRAGDILVTRQTDPGWAAVFPLISGLIVERGGMLSHGAIVAREFGIPAIVGVDQATRLLKDDDEILLNADLGEIRKHV
jgi:phosphohistidine swiveling domain-containing protein